MCVCVCVRARVRVFSCAMRGQRNKKKNVCLVVRQTKLEGTLNKKKKDKNKKKKGAAQISKQQRKGETHTKKKKKGGGEGLTYLLSHRTETHFTAFLSWEVDSALAYKAVKREKKKKETFDDSCTYTSFDCHSIL